MDDFIGECVNWRFFKEHNEPIVESSQFNMETVRELQWFYWLTQVQCWLKRVKNQPSVSWKQIVSTMAFEAETFSCGSLALTKHVATLMHYLFHNISLNRNFQL